MDFLEFFASLGNRPCGDKIGGPGEPSCCDGAVTTTLDDKRGLGGGTAVEDAAVDAGTAVTVNKFWLTFLGADAVADTLADCGGRGC